MSANLRFLFLSKLVGIYCPNFGGQHIPVSFGPWKFNGLPGAILSVVDKTGDVEFSAIKISTAQVDNIIEEPLYYEEVTKEKLAEINDNYTSQINTNFTVIKNGEQYAPVPKIKKKINNPIELQ
ncbi:GLPGLI family protein [Flavobacterium sp. GSP14]|uniref:GLPGLI family protein n=1 Tax=Flavobacterium sp. GSP14 TaxID=3401734 RepID=UPI003AACA547